ncbi:MAG: hypothetical protein VX746_01700 [Candidatus Neomarinimicrobiota bacterium]|nr:hypothetical protein [Candidatus Neomarinimicrobiota bacterium]
MKYEFDIFSPEEMGKYIRDFKSLEKTIEYPLEDGLGNFRIIHGDNYHTFFTQQGFKTRFVAIKYDHKVIGTVAGVWKPIKIRNKDYTGFYISDLKIDIAHRKKNILTKLLWYLIKRWPFNSDYQGWHFNYFCTMLRDGKGVDKSFKGFNPTKLPSRSATMNIYMVDPSSLQSLDLSSLPENENTHSVNLSPFRQELVLWNDGIKDIHSTTDNSIMQLGHLHPQLLTKQFSSKLDQCISEIKNKDNGLACFAVDDRETKKISWLHSSGITTNTQCNIFSFSPFAPSLKKSDILFISTGEI